MTTTTELQAGRELDVLVAEKVMGLEIFSRNWPVQHFSDDTCEIAPEDWETKQPGRWGRQRDAVWKYRGRNIHGEEYSGLGRVPEYSTDIDAAWQVLEKFSEREYGKVRLTGSYYHGWYCSIFWGPGLDGEGETPEPVFGATAPEAICRAALKAVETT